MNDLRVLNVATRACLVLALMVAVGGAATWIAQGRWFDFQRIDVRGDLRHISTASMRAALAGRLQGNFLTMNLNRTQRAFEAVPWVAAASVRRVWPNRLVVTVREHRALGLWSDGRLLSDDGRLFVANVDEALLYGPLVAFDGPALDAAAAAAQWRTWRATLAPLQLAIDRIEISDRHSWALQTTAGSRIELGRDDPPGRIDARLTAIAAAYPSIVAQLQTTPTRIDARYPNGFAAAPARVTDSAAPPPRRSSTTAR